MQPEELSDFISRLFVEIEKRIPGYLQNPEDERIANGNCAACIIDADGNVWGKLYGTYRIRAREAYRVAWTKASQVLITGLKTGEFEKKYFAGEVEDFGIEAPDFIGWEGGQRLVLRDGTQLSVGFSGIRGIYDLEIMVKAKEAVEKEMAGG